jgi:hypothetical protein
MDGNISNCLITHCDFNIWGGENIYTGATNAYPTNTPNTTPWNGSVGIFCSGCRNVNILENTYNGNTNLVPSTNNSFGYVNTNGFQHVAPDGFAWLESGGNYFVARNSISNYELEGIAVDAGPNSVVGNTYYTLVSDGACCALNSICNSTAGLTGFDPINNVTCFIGNSVHGGRNGESPQGENSNPSYSLNFSGNYLSLYPPLPQEGSPSAAVYVRTCASVNVFGNTLAYGGQGIMFDTGCNNAVIMNNNFANATYRGIGLAVGGGTLQQAAIFNNIIGPGSTFHVQLPFANSFGWFLNQNEYLDASGNNVPPFLDPISSAVHQPN